MPNKESTKIQYLKKHNICGFAILFLIIAFGFFLRIYNIENVPPGIFPDEAINGEDAIRASESRNYQLFYKDNEGREGLFMNIIAFSFKLFDISITSLKLPAIIFSTLSILGIYFLVKELFRKIFQEERTERLALIAAFLTAVSFWSINLARISFRANMLPAILAFAFYFFFRGLRSKKWLDFGLSGIIFGIGMHTYISWRIAPLILIALLPIFFLSRKNFFKDYWKPALIFIFFFLIISIPIFYSIYNHPEFLHAPIDDISVFSPVTNHGHPIMTFLKSFFLSLAKYNFWGDPNWRHNFPPYPILDPLTGIAFLFGFIFSLVNFFHLLKSRFLKENRQVELEIFSFLIFSFFVMLIPEFFSAENNPHALRSIGTLIPVFIFAAIAFDYLFLEYQKKKYSYLARKTAVSILFFALILIGIFNPIKYFFFWANKPIVAKSFEKNLTDISRYIRNLPSEEEKFIVSSFGPYHSPLDRLPIQIFNLNLSNTTYLYSWQNFDQIRPKTNNFIVILTGKDVDTEDRLKLRFPNLTLKEVRNPLGSIFYILK